MRSFSCPTCSQLVFMDNDQCLRCGTPLAFDASTLTVVAAPGDGRCANHQMIGCSWLVEEGQELCRSCRLTRTHPPTSDAQAMEEWATAEVAKRQLVAQMIDLDLDVSGVTFDLISSAHEPVTTGHADGVITLDVRESDDVNRVKVRERMGEAYRTMLGHFRHEIGHFLWMTMVDGTEWIDSCRAVFGDERADYGEALQVHYDSPDPQGWEESYVSVYATAHPWEDFAETLAHYLHIRGTLQTAAAFGLAVDGSHPVLDATPEAAEQAVEDEQGIRPLIDEWLPLTYALNAVNRSMGAKPLYPFVLAPTVIDKLGWVHRLVLGLPAPSPASTSA